ncbi:uncharacterized protein ACR2FA_011086 [Aphomia sociella]
MDEISGYGNYLRPRMTLKLKGKIYKSIIKPVVMYVSACWVIKGKDERIMHANEMRMLRLFVVNMAIKIGYFLLTIAAVCYGLPADSERKDSAAGIQSQNLYVNSYQSWWPNAPAGYDHGGYLPSGYGPDGFGSNGQGQGGFNTGGFGLDNPDPVGFGYGYLGYGGPVWGIFKPNLHNVEGVANTDQDQVSVGHGTSGLNYNQQKPAEPPQEQNILEVKSNTDDNLNIPDEINGEQNNWNDWHSLHLAYRPGYMGYGAFKPIYPIYIPHHPYIHGTDNNEPTNLENGSVGNDIVLNEHPVEQ